MLRMASNGAGVTRPELEALRRADLLDTPPEARFDRITRLVADVLDVPVCLVSLIDNDRQFFMSATGLPEPWASLRETPLSHSFCKHVVESRDTLVVRNATEDPRVIDNKAIGDLGVTAYLGVPVHADGLTVGALCAIDHKPRSWTDAEVERLHDFAAIVDSEIHLRLLARESAEAREEAELLAGESAHRAKNSLTVAASLISLSAAEADTPDDLARIARERIMALSAVQDVLRGDDTEQDLGGVISRILDPYAGSADRNPFRVSGAAVHVPGEKITPLGLIIHELATNACKHGALRTPGGAIALDWRAGPDGLTIDWSESDGAAGAQAHSEIEVPGLATSTDHQGFGSRLVDLCVRQLGGEISVSEEPGNGRRIALRMPLSG